jgi:hypothetical protein
MATRIGGSGRIRAVPTPSRKPSVPTAIKAAVLRATDLKGKVRISGFNMYSPGVPNARKDLWTINVAQGSGKGSKLQEFVVQYDAPKLKIIEKDAVQVQKTEHIVDD